MTREKMVEVLERIALLLELKGENPFKIRAYRSGAEVVEGFPGDIVARAAANDLEGISGLGSALRDKLHELASTGRLEFYDKLAAGIPETLFDLFEIPGLGPKKVKALYNELGIDSPAALKQACESGRLADLPGFGARTVEKLLAALAYRQANADRFRQNEAVAAVGRIHDWLRGHEMVDQVEPAGSWRRGKETLHDLDFVVASSRGAELLQDFCRQPWVRQVEACGETKASVILEEGVPCDVRAVKGGEFACALAYFTGSKEHNVLVRGRARDRGYTLNEYRLAPLDKDGGKVETPPEFSTEAELYGFLGLEWIDPALREGGPEIEAAENGALPRLVQLTDLRGALHNHTNASDGAVPLRDMVEGARGLGLQYFGLADHSKSSFQANGLDAGRLRRQIGEVARENERLADEEADFWVLSGSEVDILKDGRLDFDDDLLAELDCVVASVHNAFTLGEAEMTSRILKAVENPHVDIIGHLTGRLLLRREPYQVNIDAVLEAAAGTGTVIELNANPWRLDLDWRWWRRARELGVRCAINPDAHSVEGLKDMFFGVRIARKGWLGRDDVINCMTRGELREFLAKPKADRRR